MFIFLFMLDLNFQTKKEKTFISSRFRYIFHQITSCCLVNCFFFSWATNVSAKYSVFYSDCLGLFSAISRLPEWSLRVFFCLIAHQFFHRKFNFHYVFLMNYIKYVIFESLVVKHPEFLYHFFFNNFSKMNHKWQNHKDTIQYILENTVNLNVYQWN